MKKDNGEEAIKDINDTKNMKDTSPTEKPHDRRDLIDVEDMLNVTLSKVSLLCDCFCPHRHEDELFSPNGLRGFRVILRGIEDDLKVALDQLAENRERVNP